MGAYEAVVRCYKNGGKALICGNGGSAADSGHIAAELMKGFMLKRPIPEAEKRKLSELFPGENGGEYLADKLQRALPAISLCEHAALITAITNDVAADMIFAQQVYGYGARGDVLIAISTSGSAKNVINAVKTAKFKEMTSIGLTGESGGKLYGLCDITIRVPAVSTPEVQELHLPVYHAICMAVENKFFGGV
jgi:D-sedoheptulose 7-phosphate isomerase